MFVARFKFFNLLVLQGIIMIATKESMENDAVDLTDVDRLVIAIVSSGSVRRTRLQKLSLLHSAISLKNPELLHSAHFFGGYSDDVEESSEDLLDIGVLRENGTTYSLSEYGKSLKNYLDQNDAEFKNMSESVHGLVSSLSKVSDEKIVAMTYAFYPELTTQSTIMDKVNNINDKMTVNNKPVKTMSRAEFEKMLLDKNILSVE
jgi:hypothetical protein